MDPLDTGGLLYRLPRPGEGSGLPVMFHLAPKQVHVRLAVMATP